MSIQQWTKSQELKEIQDDFLHNKIPDGCSACIENEKKTNHSTRLGALKDYGTEIFTDTKIDYIDYRSSNICNFRCRSCEPYFSNGIANEIKKNPQLDNFLKVDYYIKRQNANKLPNEKIDTQSLSDYQVAPSSKTTSTEEKDYNWIIKNLAQIKKLMITGGEPTKIPSVKMLVDYIREHKIIDLQLLITSNASFTDSYWFDITKELPNIHWTLSLDAVGLAAEVIRDGTVWSTVSRNIETMFDISPSVNIGTVITNLNLFQLKPLFRFVNDLDKKYSHRNNGRTQFIQFCQWPTYMAPTILDEDQKKQALEYLESFDLINLQPSQVDAIKALISMIKNQTGFPKERLQLSNKYNTILDQIRGQSHEWLFTPAH